MADQEQRAGVFLQRRLQQLERLDVEVVGRLVQHQQVRRPREQAREQQAVALAAREHRDRRLRALRRKQEVPEVADDVLARPPPISTQSDPGLIVSATVRSGSSCSRIWSK